MIQRIHSFFETYPHWEGALWKTVASGCFALLGALVKYMTLHPDNQGVQVQQIVFLENTIGMILILLPQIRNFQGLKPQLKRYDLHALRIISSSAGILLWYQALIHMPLALASSLSFTSPAITLLFARLFLKERISAQDMMAISLSFVGAAIIIRPDQKLLLGLANFDSNMLYMMIPLLSSACLAASKVVSRSMASQGESPRIMGTYLLLFMAPMTALYAIPTWAPMNSLQLKLIWVSGLCTAIAHWAISQAYACATVTFLTPFSFTRVFLGGIFGFLLFEEAPFTTVFLIGTVLIFSSVVLLTLRKHPAKPAA